MSSGGLQRLTLAARSFTLCEGVFRSPLEVGSPQIHLLFMSKKQALIYAIVFAILVGLMYLQFRTWRDFDWSTFWRQTNGVSLVHIAGGIAIIYFAYVMRALRWDVRQNRFDPT